MASDSGVGWWPWLLGAIALKLVHLFVQSFAQGRKLSRSDISIKYEVVQRGSDGKSAVLVTGGTGYLGRHIVDLLMERFSEEFAVHVLDAGAKHASNKHPQVTYIQGDIRAPNHVRAAVRGKVAVIHCAALLEAADTDLQLMREVNVAGTRHVVEACLEADVQALVYTSSVSVHYRHNPLKLESVPRIMETEPTPPEFNLLTEYCRSKKAAERFVQGANGHVTHTCILRPGGIHGVGDTFITDAVFSPWNALPDTQCTHTPYVWVRDAARAHVAAMIALLHPHATSSFPAPSTSPPTTGTSNLSNGAAAAAEQQQREGGGDKGAELLARALKPWPAPASAWDPDTQTAWGTVQLKGDLEYQQTFLTSPSSLPLPSIASGSAGATAGSAGQLRSGSGGVGKAATGVAGKAFHLVYDRCPVMHEFLGAGHPKGSKTNVYGIRAKSTAPMWLVQRLCDMNLYLGQHFGVLILPPMATPANLVTMTTDWMFDITQAKSVLGWQPTPWPTVVKLILAERAARSHTRLHALLQRGRAAAAAPPAQEAGKLKSS